MVEVKTQLNFKDVELSDKSWINQCMKESDFRGSESVSYTHLASKNIDAVKSTAPKTTKRIYAHFSRFQVWNRKKSR